MIVGAVAVVSGAVDAGVDGDGSGSVTTGEDAVESAAGDVVAGVVDVAGGVDTVTVSGVVSWAARLAVA